MLTPGVTSYSINTLITDHCTLTTVHKYYKLIKLLFPYQKYQTDSMYLPVQSQNMSVILKNIVRLKTFWEVLPHRCNTISHP